MRFEITYGALFVSITLAWLLIRMVCCVRARRVDIRRELTLLLVYISLVVVARFTFFPFSRVNGMIQPLVFDLETAVPPRLNVVPLVNLFDYESRRELLLNLIGNTLMFLPLGMVWPIAFRRLHTHKDVLLSGFATSLCIEILQLPFYDRVSDIDDLLLNTLGFAAGYGILLLARRIKAVHCDRFKQKRSE
jgi:glycopeptide antibiotics resistance protein